MNILKRPYKTGVIGGLEGCFTEEYCLRGLSVNQIGAELGFLKYRMEKGIFIAYAIELPEYHQFELGGWAAFSTDKFVDYDKETKISTWSEERFEETYSGYGFDEERQEPIVTQQRFPISIEDAKMGWMKNMRNEKLIKILTVAPGQGDEKYPAGGKASQILVTSPIRCEIVQFLKGDQIFKGVWM